MNSVSLIGRLGRDPESRFTSGGKAITNFSIAVDDGFGEQKQTYWFPIVVWGKTAEAAGKYLKKGSQVAIEGRLQIRSWDDKEGNKRTVTEIVANRLDFLTKAPTSSQSEQNFDADPKIADEDIPF